MLEKAGIPHNVLNAKQHEREAIIIAQAGRPGAVTIATNMAGRGVDILLGGNPEGLARETLRKDGVEITELTPEQWQAALEKAKAEVARDKEIVINAGGLYVIGTERHEARRIDNQLRGRSGRQGDPGASQFYLSLEDDLMRRFGGERVKNLMKTLNMPEDEPIQHSLITKSIQQAQIRIEGYNFDIRKRVLEYDDVVNKQREVIYKQRRQVLNAENLREQIERMTAEEIHSLVETYLPESNRDEWETEELYRAALTIYPVPDLVNHENWIHEDIDDIELELVKGAIAVYDQVEARIGSELMRVVERQIMLRAIDQLWVRHLTDLDILREGIGLVAIGQRDPLVEYKRESFGMWEELQSQIQQQVVRTIYRVEIKAQPVPGQVQPGRVPQATDGQAQGQVQGQPQAGAPTGQPVQPSAPQRMVQIPNMPQFRNVRAGMANNVTAAAARIASSAGAADTPKANAVPDSAAEPARADMWSRVGRNDPCPCGSGKKFKNCHYREVQEQRNTVDQSEVKKTVPNVKRKK
jgi:preprotein translocase subunit SecA